MSNPGDQARWNYFVEAPGGDGQPAVRLPLERPSRLHIDALIAQVNTEVRGSGVGASLSSRAGAGARLLPGCINVLYADLVLLSVPLAVTVTGGLIGLFYVLSAGGINALFSGATAAVIAKSLPLAAILCALGAIERGVLVIAMTPASNGGTPRLTRAWVSALRHLPTLLITGIAQASIDSISFLLRTSRLGRLAAGVLDISWEFGTVLMVPTIVVERRSFVSATRRSVQLAVRAWGIELRARPIISLAVGLYSLPLLLVGAALAFEISATAGMFVIGGTVIAAAGISSALNGVLCCAVYQYAVSLAD